MFPTLQRGESPFPVRHVRIDISALKSITLPDGAIDILNWQRL